MTSALHTIGNPEDRAAKISHAVVTVTPEMAKRWLDNNNTRNRDISEFRVQQYISDMEAGRWEFNGETIQFDRSGALLNGQHRLMAIVQTGIPQPFLIVRGLSPDAQLTMDQGTRRSPKDQLSIAGITTDSTIPASIRIYIRWQKGLLFGDQVGKKLTTSEIVQWAVDHPDKMDLLRDLSEAGVRRAPCAGSMALAVALRFSLIDERDCLLFFDKLTTGAELSANSPIFALRKRLLAARDTNTKISERDHVGFFTMAWNAHRAGRPMQKLQRPRGGSWSVDNFPEPH